MNLISNVGCISIIPRISCQTYNCANADYFRPHMSSNLPASVTVVTVVYNGAAVVERTMRSVSEQSWPHVHHLVIDGASKDDTLEIVHRFARPQLKVVSEKDKGIYDAMNKGISQADGDYIVFMNAGDEFYSNDVLEKLLSRNDHADFYYGNTMVVDDHGKELGDRRLHPPTNLSWKSLKFGMCVSHQSILVKRKMAVDYDLKFKISADIDWTIRVLKNAKTIVNSEMYVSKFLRGGVSSSRRREGLKERFQIMIKHYGLFSTIVNHAYITFRFIVHLFTKRNLT